MRRIFSRFAYGEETRNGCWWDETITAPEWPVLKDALSVDVAIVGAGFTGVSAAHQLAQSGATVAVVEGNTPGWGASGRNGGFCCLGGAKLSDAAMVRQFGDQASKEYSLAERSAVELVSSLLEKNAIDADRHSHGETQLAHRPRDMEAFRKRAKKEQSQGQPDTKIIEPEDLAAYGMNGPFHGAMTTPIGFAINPRKYLFGLARAAESAGAKIFQKSAVSRIERKNGQYTLSCELGEVRAQNVLIATNGYSSEDVPNWLAGRYIPSQSNVLVTRPLSIAELEAQGWTSDQMAYDTRNLLHYFRLMPDRRFLFGRRGGLTSSRSSEKRARLQTRRDFERMFPAWSQVESAHQWSGLVCLSRRRVPYVGPVPGQPGMYAGLAYHGNGVAMGSYSGHLLADLALGRQPEKPYPAVMALPMARFPFGRMRRVVMPPAYLYYGVRDL